MKKTYFGQVCWEVCYNFHNPISNSSWRELMWAKFGHLPFCFSAFLAVFIFFFELPESQASRFHVKTTGTRLSGPSIPNDWSDGNCYSAIYPACRMVAPQDSVLLFRETHELGQAVEIPKFLGNQDLDFNFSDVSLVLSTLGRVLVNGDFPHLMVRGISFESDGENSSYAALELKNIGGQLEQAFIHSCSFTNLQGSDSNSELAGGGAAIRADGEGNNAYLEIRDCHFENNRCSGGGGAVFFGDNYEVFISDTDFINNLSDIGFQQHDGRGGAIYLKSQNVRSDLTIVDCNLDRNKSRGPGGAISIEDGSLVLISTDILNSRSAFGATTNWAAGAGLFMRGTGGHDQAISLEMRGCNVSGNRGDLSSVDSTGDGGGVLVKGISGHMVDVVVAECSFDSNFNAQGAGLYIGRFTNGEVGRCSFRNNTARNHGGGSFKGGAFSENLGETVVYSYCEFVGNRAGYTIDGIETNYGGRGGAFMTRLNPRAFFFNCTFLDNYTGLTTGVSDAIFMGLDNGVFDDDLKRCRLINCLFYGETGQDQQIDMYENAFGLVTHCAFEEGQFLCPGVETVETVILDGNPCTSLTDINLVSGSSCIDSGLLVDLYEDLVGDVVPQGDGPDIGAREYSGPPSPVAQDLEIPLGSIHSARVWPNPFNPRVQIGFNLESSIRIEVTVYDIRGAVVKHLFSGSLPAGPHEFHWDGSDETGRSVASGSYRSVISGNGRQIRTRMTLIR